jgi:hypothetical protein
MIPATDSATSRRPIDFFQLIDADKPAVTGENGVGDYKPDSISTSTSPAASQSLCVFKRGAASSIINEPRRPRVKMIILLWATWVVAVVAYLAVIGPE